MSDNGGGDTTTGDNGGPRAAPPPRQNLEALVGAFVTPIVACALRGAMVSVPQIKGEEVAVAFCRALGTIIGGTFVGELVNVLRIRRRCREAFVDALQKARPPAAGPLPPDLPVAPAGLSG